MPPFPKTVFVLGAGFTRAFFPKAPLLTDDYNGELVAKVKNLPYASRILELERSKNPEGKINIERLMTRLDGKMPYDFGFSAKEELSLLLSELKHAFIRRLEETKTNKSYDSDLKNFARYCINRRINCLTFNYDDLFDQALWEIRGLVETDLGDSSYWHPDGGYGFFCKPSADCVMQAHIHMDQTAILLLKLHGSVNWRIRRGAPCPHGIDAIVHHEQWLKPPLPDGWIQDENIISAHLEPEPFIVPPVLMKAAVTLEPILQVVWSKAYETLKKAEQVVFIGYSLPVTDIAAGFLFGEALQHPDLSLKVVILPRNEEDEEKIKNAYRNVFSNIKDDQFEFRDALEWVSDLVKD